MKEPYMKKTLHLQALNEQGRRNLSYDFDNVTINRVTLFLIYLRVAHLGQCAI